MPLKFLKNLFGKSPSPDAEPADLPSLMARDAQRFAAWVSERTGEANVTVGAESVALAEKALEQAREEAKGKLETPDPEALRGALPENLASDAAAFFGEAACLAHGGLWIEHGLMGLVLGEFGSIYNGHLVPLAMVQKKWELGPELSLSRFYATLPERIDLESQSLDYHQTPALDPKEMGKEILMTGLQDPNAPGVELTQEFQKFWKSRFKADLPVSLQGVREVDRFLRSHFFLYALHEETLIQAGFFLGEVGRGLYEGAWHMDNVADGNNPLKAELVWPEITYYPVGKIYKFMTEREEQTLDEYLRLVPSARKAMVERNAAEE
ncbi:MAG: hypothetical protein RLY93_19520 [Sumerlaeia bacterium]